MPMGKIYRVKKRKIPVRLTKKDNKVVSKAVSRVINLEEMKQSVTTVSPAAAIASAQNGTLGLLFNITRSTTAATDRIGNKVRLMKLQIRGSFANGAATAPATIRVVIFRDMQINGIIGTNAQLMFDTTAATNFNSPFREDNKKRFRILSDKRYALNNDGGATDQQALRMYKFTKRWKKGALLQYNTGTANTVADCISGQLFYAVYTDVAAGAPFIAWDVNVLFKDA